MKSKLIQKNKKGDVAITILVIGVFVISTFAILSFVLSEFSYGNSFVGISVMQKVNAAIDEYNFYKNNGVSSEVIDSEFNFISENNIKYLYYEEKKINWIGKNNGLSFSVKYPVSKS